MTDSRGEIDVSAAVFRLVTIAHVAVMFDCSTKHVSRLIASGSSRGSRKARG